MCERDNEGRLNPVYLKDTTQLGVDIQELIRSSNVIPKTLVLGEPISGGYASQVYAGSLEGRSVIIKHTEDVIADDILLSKESIGTGVEVLTRLQTVRGVRVPELIAFDPEITTIVMEDLRPEGYKLLPINVEQHHSLPPGSAGKVGLALANLVSASRSWGQVATTRTALENMHFSTKGLVDTYGLDSPYQQLITQRFTTQNQGWVWWDSTPKNMLVRADGDIALIDFESSCYGDRQITLPMFLAHMTIYGITGNIDQETALMQMQESIAAFRDIENLDENALCKYLGMEVLSNAGGQFTRLPVTAEQTKTLETFGKRIFEADIQRFDDLWK